MKVFPFLFNDCEEKPTKGQGVMSVYRLSHDRGSFFQRVRSLCMLVYTFVRFASRPYVWHVRRDKALICVDMCHHPWPYY